jgi:hypothetical protein
MKLITEMSYDFEIAEDKKTKDMYAVGIFSSAELLNNNKRMYKKDILEREVTKVQEKIEKKCLWGELGHPPNPEVNPDKIALRTTQLEWRGNDLYGKAKILDTPMGQIAKTLVKEGQMGISSRGLGTVGDDGYVNEDFHLITWDLVTDPSNNPSWVNGIFEGQSFTMPGQDEKAIDKDKIKEAQKVYFDYLVNTINGIGNSIDDEIQSAGSKKHFALVQDLIGNFNGAIGWLEDMKEMVKQGNWKTARQTYTNLMKNLKKISKSFG